MELDHKAAPPTTNKKPNLKKTDIKKDKAVKFNNNQDLPKDQDEVENHDEQEDRHKQQQQEFEAEKKRAKLEQENAKDELEVA